MIRLRKLFEIDSEEWARGMFGRFFRDSRAPQTAENLGISSRDIGRLCDMADRALASFLREARNLGLTARPSGWTEDSLSRCSAGEWGGFCRLRVTDTKTGESPGISLLSAVLERVQFPGNPAIDEQEDRVTAWINICGEYGDETDLAVTLEVGGRGFAEIRASIQPPHSL